MIHMNEEMLNNMIESIAKPLFECVLKFRVANDEVFNDMDKIHDNNEIQYMLNLFNSLYFGCIEEPTIERLNKIRSKLKILRSNLCELDKCVIDSTVHKQRIILGDKDE